MGDGQTRKNQTKSDLAGPDQTWQIILIKPISIIHQWGGLKSRITYNRDATLSLLHLRLPTNPTSKNCLDGTQVSQFPSRR